MRINCDGGIREMCMRHGHSPTSYLTLSPRLSKFTCDRADGYIAWGRSGATAVALTDPMAAPKDLPELTAAFRQERESRGDNVVFFGVTGRFEREFTSMGYHRYVLGRDPVLDVERFSLKGNRMGNVRRMAAHALRSGLEVMELRGESDADLFREMHEISREWIRLKRTPELSHLVWKLDESPNPDIRYFVARSASRVEGFVTYNPIYAAGDWYLDLTRRRACAENGVLDLLIVESMKKLRAGGMERMYLGMVPDPDIHLQMYRGGLMRRLVGIAAYFSDLLYPVKGERFFKEKYRPRWSDLYIFSAGELSAWRLWDLLEFFLPQGLTGVLGHKLAASIF